MRKFIIQFFALDYAVFMFNRRVTWTRSANVIFPLMTLNGLLAVKENVPLELSVSAFVLLALALFFGFLYFDLKPLQPEDYKHFDDVQKFTWEIQQGKHPLEMTEQVQSSTWAFWCNPIAVFIFLILCYLS